MTEAILIVALLGAMYAVARLYPAPPNPGVVWFLPEVLHRLSRTMTESTAGFLDFERSLSRVADTFTQIEDSEAQWVDIGYQEGWTVGDFDDQIDSDGQPWTE